MKDGFIKVAAITTHVKVADCVYNARQTALMLKKASAEGIKLAVFPELGITAYTCADLFRQRTLLEGALNGLKHVLDASKSLDIVAVVGLPLVVTDKLYNCAAVISKGEVLAVVPKSCIPNYGEYYERRWFTSAPGSNTTIDILGYTVPFGTNLLFCCSQLPNFCFAIEICEDLWVPAPPSSMHAQAGATVIVNLSASNELIGKDQYRHELVKGQSGRALCAYVYANAGSGESSTDLVFTGHNMIAENGIMLAEQELGDQGLLTADIDIERLGSERLRVSTFFDIIEIPYMKVYFSLTVTETHIKRHFERFPFVPSHEKDLDSRCKQIIRLQATALATRIAHTNVQSVVVGVSGGLDSTLALLVAIEAFDRLGLARANVVAITMPCFGTTKRTMDNAIMLCQSLGVTLRSIDITKAVEIHFNDIGHDKNVHDVVFENSQARERTQVLMDVANQVNALVIGTGDLSELALGWATYNGDHMSMYAVNSSIPKTLVRHLVSYWARTQKGSVLEKVLLDILDTPVSPELLPAIQGAMSQPTEKIIGPYELHDFFLYYGIRWAFRPAKILRIALITFAGLYDRPTILKWLKLFYRRFFSQQFKRSCLPDGPKIGSVALSPRGDWRMPSDAAVSLWLDEVDQLQ